MLWCLMVVWLLTTGFMLKFLPLACLQFYGPKQSYFWVCSPAKQRISNQSCCDFYKILDSNPMAQNNHTCTSECVPQWNNIFQISLLLWLTTWFSFSFVSSRTGLTKIPASMCRTSTSAACLVSNMRRVVWPLMSFSIALSIASEVSHLHAQIP